MSKFLSRRGFTLIELLIVVIIIGIIAAIALPRFADVKNKAYVSTLSSDLRTMATAQEVAANGDTLAYYKTCTDEASNGCAELPNFTASPDVNFTSAPVTDSTQGWAGNTRHLKIDSSSSRCLHIGNASNVEFDGTGVPGVDTTKAAGSQYKCTAAY